MIVDHCPQTQGLENKSYTCVVFLDQYKFDPKTDQNFLVVRKSDP